MTQFILPSASISVTIVIPLKVFATYISPRVCIPPKLCREVKSDFSLQLGETWQVVLESLVSRRKTHCVWSLPPKAETNN